MSRSISPELLAWVREAEGEAMKKLSEGGHISADIIDAYSLDQSKLSNDTIESIEKHLYACKRCKQLVKTMKSKAAFFLYQKVTRGDCDR